jgi:hypothetical protein
MVRYTLFVLAIIGSAATALASISAMPVAMDNPNNVTVIEKNQFWPLEGKLVVEQCAVEDCSDTPQG